MPPRSSGPSRAATIGSCASSSASSGSTWSPRSRCRSVSCSPRASRGRRKSSSASPTTSDISRPRRSSSRSATACGSRSSAPSSRCRWRSSTRTRSRARACPFADSSRPSRCVPILVPSLLPGLALVYLFGNQGLLKGALLGHSIYGPIGIVMAEVFTTFPHALLIILAALALADARLYEAAVALRASRPKIFWTVTLPGARYGLISATFVVFTTVVTDFGAPKVIGGQYNVLATDVLQAGHRPAELPDGRCRQRDLAGARDLRLHGRSRGAAPAGGAPLRARRALPASAAAPVRPPDAGLLRRDGARHPEHRRDLPVRGRREVLSLQPDPDDGALRLRPEGRRGLGLVLQLDPAGVPDGCHRNRGRVRRRLSRREGAGLRAGPRHLPLPGDAPDGGARARPRPRLHLLLQRARRIRSTCSTARWRSWSSTRSCTSTPWGT